MIRIWAGETQSEPEPGTIWHLITVQQAYLRDGSSKDPIVKWFPNFKEPETFRLWSESNRSLQFLSDWESGKEPFAQFALFR